VTKRLRQHWPNTRIVWRGDGHYGRVEAMEWAENEGSASGSVPRTDGFPHRAFTRCREALARKFFTARGSSMCRAISGHSAA
jgi:hypothetical protein